MGLWSRTYVCCAVPLCKLRASACWRQRFTDSHQIPLLHRCRAPLDYDRTEPYVGHADNGGIYAIMAQFLIVSLVTGVLCFAAPSSAWSPRALSSRKRPTSCATPR